jgi:hypothetical protein
MSVLWFLLPVLPSETQANQLCLHKKNVILPGNWCPTWVGNWQSKGYPSSEKEVSMWDGQVLATGTIDRFIVFVFLCLMFRTYQNCADVCTCSWLGSVVYTNTDSNKDLHGIWNILVMFCPRWFCILILSAIKICMAKWGVIFSVTRRQCSEFTQVLSWTSLVTLF